MALFDFITRRNNPSNTWRRRPGLDLRVELDVPSLCGVKPGERLEHLSFLGRTPGNFEDALMYPDLGLIVYYEGNAFDSFELIFRTWDADVRPFPGTVNWRGRPLQLGEMTLDDLQQVLGDWYWLWQETYEDDEIDEEEEEEEYYEEYTAFFEFPNLEIQAEASSLRRLSMLSITCQPAMADPETREVLKVDKPWPPA